VTDLEPCWQESVQALAYRDVLRAVAEPGTVVSITGAGERAALVVLAVLVDGAVTLADPQDRLSARERSLLGAVTAPPDQARFVVLDGRRPPPPDFAPDTGTLLSPEGGAWVILEVDDVAASGLPGDGEPWLLSGPGIDGIRPAVVAGLHGAWRTWRASLPPFPRGVDLLLADARKILALPRTSTLQEGI
jgi:alpha-D-ribose 1-methylphosphonate 5-triphosphate synthase subunit PhnH